MLSVYDPLCDGLRDPRGIGSRAMLSWRLGSDEPDTRQVACRVVVVSMRSGDVAWDSGRVRTRRTSVFADCGALMPGETCAWFVTVWDNHGSEAYGVPSAFVRALAGESPSSELGAQRREFVRTSDRQLNALLEEPGGERLRMRLWREVLGLSCACMTGKEGDMLVSVEPGIPQNPLDGTVLSSVCGSMLVGRGLMVLGIARDAEPSHELSLPPGVSAQVRMGDKTVLLGPGHHAW